MTRAEYVEKVLEIAREKPAYALGGDGSNGKCDCVGLGIGALRRGGIKYTGIHGSNWAARKESVELWQIESVSELTIGDNVLKAYEPGDKGWSLPSRYAKDADQRDYYHLGVVTSVNPLRITHCTTPTIKTDTTLGRWKYAFRWKHLSVDVNYEPAVEVDAVYKATVKLKTSKYLNLRVGPSTDDTKIGKIPNGGIVEVLTAGDAWSFVRYDGMSGYVNNQYLVEIEEEPDDSIHVQLVITDSAGNTFIPVGDFSAKLEVVCD